jgi:sporulation protein YlmC with PRC-barrel domain
MPANGQSATTPPTSPSTQMGPATQGQATATDLTGQTIYSAKGSKIGKVTAMSTDAHGQQAAAVSIERYLGMGGQTVLIPVSSLQARNDGGYATSLSSTELKSLATSGSGSTTTP